MTARALSSLESLERRLPLVYLALAGTIVLTLCFVTAPFFGPDEANQSLRAIALSHGELLPEVGPDEAGAAIDSGVLSVTNEVDQLRMTWEKRSNDYLDRSYGPMTLAELRSLQPMRFSHHAQFAGFGNTATYPPFLYLPAMAGWSAGDAFGLTVLATLRLARVLCGLTSIALGWAALSLTPSGVRWLLFAYLMLPTTLFLDSTCSQDSVLLGAAALAIALPLRPVASGRSFRVRELVAASLLLAACAAARPPYAAVGLLVFLPVLELRARRTRDWIEAALGCVAVVGTALFWRFFVRGITIDTADEADPALQTAYLLHHPFATAAALLRGTATAAYDLLHRGLYVLGWNDLLPHHGAAFVLTLCLLAVVWCAPVQLRLTRWGQLLLAGSIAGALLAVSLAEYLIWTPPGLGTVYGIMPRYWLPILPLLLLLLSSLRPGRVRGTVSQWVVLEAAVGLTAMACSLPFFACAAFYREPIAAVIRTVLAGR